MRPSLPTQTNVGLLHRVLPLFKWRRPDGLASFLYDRLGLRKSIALCHSCERKMSSKWLALHDYALVEGYHMEGLACDYCRDPYTTMSLFCPGEGDYYREWKFGRDAVRDARARDRALMQKDWRYIMPGTY